MHTYTHTHIHYNFQVSMHMFLVGGLINGREPDTDTNSIIGKFEIGNFRGYGAIMNDE